MNFWTASSHVFSIVCRSARRETESLSTSASTAVGESQLGVDARVVKYLLVDREHANRLDALLPFELKQHVHSVEQRREQQQLVVYQIDVHEVSATHLLQLLEQVVLLHLHRLYRCAQQQDLRMVTKCLFLFCH